MTDIQNWSMDKINKLGVKVVIQAVRDFAFPEKIDRVKVAIVKLDKNDPMYKDNKRQICNRERKDIIRQLKNPFLSALSAGKSDEAVLKLERIFADKTGAALKMLRARVKSASTDN